MIFVGNDIVDLAATENIGVAKNSRYLSKILVADEKRFLQKSFSDQQVWALWSIKEAAYKIGIKQGLPIGFYPKKLIVTSLLRKNNILIASITTPSGLIHTKSYLKENLIHTIGCSNQSFLNRVQFNHFNIQNDQSVEVRNEMTAQLCLKFDITPSQIQFSKDKNSVPEVKLEQSDKQLDISFSHDGKFGAYAYIEQLSPLQSNVN